MPAEWEDEFWHHENQNLFNREGNKKSNVGVTLRPPLYNAEDYIAALKQMFSSHCGSPTVSNVKNSVLIEHSSTGQYNNTTSPKNNNHARDRDFPETPPEMTMRKFLNRSELLFKLEADLCHAYPSFVQEFVSVHCEGVLHTLEALKLIQTALDEVTGLREQRKLFMDEQKCLQCLRLCLRNIEAVSKLSTYPGGLYPIAAAMVSTVTATRILALEILTCVCSEGGPEGHFKVSEAISTLRLRMGEPIRCKLLIGAISSAPPGTFQAKGIRFLTTWVASAVSPKHKVHIQCELEEAGFNPSVLRKGAELGGARESREVQTELDAWERVSIDVDTLTRQNGQLRNSVATLQQELATLKDKLKRMDVHPKQDESRRRSSRPKRIEELVTTPADSEEEAEQIHQILEDLNNIVNSELNAPINNSGKSLQAKHSSKKVIEKDIVPIHLVKSLPLKKSTVNGGPMSPVTVTSRPWPGSSASDDDASEDDGNSSDLIQTPSPKLSPKDDKNEPNSALKNVRKVVEEIEKSGNGNSPKQLYTKHSNKSKSMSPLIEPKPDYKLLNFHKQNHMVNKFANFKSLKLYSSSPDNYGGSGKSTGNGHQDAKDKNPRFSPQLMNQSKKLKGGPSLRRSESLHTSLATMVTPGTHSSSTLLEKGKFIPANISKSRYISSPKKVEMDKWKSMDNLDMDDNFTLRWKYPNPEFSKVFLEVSPNASPKVKSQKTKTKDQRNSSSSSKLNGNGGGGVFELFNDYRQNHFSKNSKGNLEKCGGASGGGSGPVNGPHSGSTSNIFFKFSKKNSSNTISKNQNEVQNNDTKESSLKMFSLPPIFVSQGIDITNHRISDLPSGLY